MVLAGSPAQKLASQQLLFTRLQINRDVSAHRPQQLVQKLMEA